MSEMELHNLANAVDALSECIVELEKRVKNIEILLRERLGV